MNKDYRRTLRRLGLTWLMLIAMLLASLGSSYLHLGIGNTLTGIGIAVLKALLVAWIFMNLSTAAPLVRLVAMVGIGVWLLLAGLSLVDFLPRSPDPAAWQQPKQIAPLLSQPKR